MIKYLSILIFFIALTSADNTISKKTNFEYSKELQEIRTNLIIANYNLIIADSITKSKK